MVEYCEYCVVAVNINPDMDVVVAMLPDGIDGVFVGTAVGWLAVETVVPAAIGAEVAETVVLVAVFDVVVEVVLVGCIDVTVVVAVVWAVDVAVDGAVVLAVEVGVGDVYGVLVAVVTSVDVAVVVTDVLTVLVPVAVAVKLAVDVAVDVAVVGENATNRYCILIAAGGKANALYIIVFAICPTKGVSPEAPPIDTLVRATFNGSHPLLPTPESVSHALPPVHGTSAPFLYARIVPKLSTLTHM